MLKKYMFLCLMLVGNSLLCMDGDVKPFTLEEMKVFSTHKWGRNIEQAVKANREKDSFRALFEDSTCQRVLLADKEVQGAFCDNFFRWFQSDPLMTNCDCPYGDYWPAVRRMIALSALVGFATNDHNSSRFHFPEMKQGCMKSRALEVALFHDDVALAHFLLERGADPNASNSYQPNFIHARSAAMAAVLLQYGANYQHEKVRDWSPLHVACGEQHASDLIPFYLGKGCQVNGIQESTTYPPLVALAHSARFQEPEKVRAKFEALLQAGADVYHKGLNGHYTALEILRNAREGRNPNQASVKLGIKILEEAQEKLIEKK